MALIIPPHYKQKLLPETTEIAIKTIKEGNVQNVFAAKNGDSYDYNTITTLTEKSEKLTEITTQNITEKATEKATEKQTQKTTQKVTEKPTEKITQKVTEKPTEKTTVNTAQKNSESQKYVIKDGDSLSGISMKIYGNKKKVKDIMDKNVIDDPDKIYSGMVINLP